MRNLVYTLVLFLLSGCASTSITSFKDPIYGNKAYNCVIVFAAESNLEYRNRYESVLVDNINEAGIRAIKGMEILPPTKIFNKDEIDAVLEGTYCDGLLVVSNYGKTRTITYINNNDGSITPHISNHITEEISLWDNVRDKKVWMATANVSYHTIIPIGNGIESMMNNSASEIVNKLMEDKMLEINP